MRRALLAAVLAAPAVVVAQTPPLGGIVFTDGSSDLVHGPWISLAECTDATATVNLSWSTALAPAATWPASARYTAYASNRPHAAPDCTTAADSGNGTFAGPVGVTLPATAQIQDLVPFSTNGFVTATGLTCNVSADTPIYVCVQAYGSDGFTRVGYALGVLTLSIAAPSPPTDVGSASRDGGLGVTWTASPGNPAAYDFRVVAEADPPDARDAGVHELTDVAALSAELTGLVPGVQYRVQVYARSRAGNESLPAETLGTPDTLPTPDFWEGFSSAGCGCGQGGGGPEALVAVLALLAVRRRSRR